MLRVATDWLAHHHQTAMWALIALSVVMLGAAAVALPLIVVRIPVDYFSRDRPSRLAWQKAHPALRMVALLGKNVLGAMLFFAGAIMLFTPGQGVLCILLGLALLDVPGKRRLERWIAMRPPVFKALNALRQKSGYPPLEKPPP
ncbi:MAG: hypothetical protein IT427_10995 [Pirellulales bacterium]|nr:hypothetical protein [Pirellulales bacterium]